MTTSVQSNTAHRPAMALSDQQFKELSTIAFAEAGLMISDSKRQMIQSRLTRHLREICCDSLDDYFESIKKDSNRTIKNELISVLTTNVSSFFRERHHFDTFEKKLLPGLLERARSGSKVRIWSAGCSSGQEPYSLAMVLLSRVPDIHTLDIKILGTDIDLKILNRACDATYSNEETSSLPNDMRSKFMVAASQPEQGATVAKSARDLVTLRPLNLLRPWPMKQKFDAIFCRNVLIYFDNPTQKDLWPRFHDALARDGVLFLGHSERIQSPEAMGFVASGVTTYRKTIPSSSPAK